MIPLIIRKIGLLIVAFLSFANLSCQADSYSKAPTDQIIEGPFAVTTEWQTIKINPPLRTLPYVQELNLLIDHSLYTLAPDVPVTEYANTGTGFYLKDTDTVVTPQVIFINQHDKEFQVTFTSAGSYTTNAGAYKAMGFGLNTDTGKYYFDKDTEISAIKIKANVKMRVEHLQWISVHHYMNPNRRWDDAAPSKIQVFE